MRHSGVAIAAISVMAGGSASAQQPQLNDTQKLGQALFVQSCGVCHLKPQLTAPQFAPVLSRVFPWSECPVPHQMMKSNQHVGKMVVLVGAEREGLGAAS